MEEKGKYTVGTDRDTTQTVRTQLMGQAAQFIADVWKKHIYPRPYERTFRVDGIKVRVIVGEGESELTSDRSAHA